MNQSERAACFGRVIVFGQRTQIVRVERGINVTKGKRHRKHFTKFTSTQNLQDCCWIYRVSVASSQRHCHYLCSTSASCKSLQYNRMTARCSMYAAEGRYVVPSSANDDDVYFSSSKVSSRQDVWCQFPTMGVFCFAFNLFVTLKRCM